MRTIFGNPFFLLLIIVSGLLIFFSEKISDNLYPVYRLLISSYLMGLGGALSAVEITRRLYKDLYRQLVALIIIIISIITLVYSIFSQGWHFTTGLVFGLVFGIFIMVTELIKTGGKA